MNHNETILHCLLILAHYIILILTHPGIGVDGPDHGSDTIHQTINNPPSVRIVVPEEGAEIKMSSSVRYMVTVSDTEDGSTKYGEIEPNEVYVELSCWPNLKEANDYRSRIRAITEDPPGLRLIQASGCFNCHQDKTRLMGPSFEDIATRYSSDPLNIRNLADNVLHGSTGTWGDVQMPANPELSRENVLQAVQYILRQGGNKNSSIYSGFEGAIRPIKPLNDTTCVYVLATYYTDKGKEQMPGTTLRGQHSILLK